MANEVEVVVKTTNKNPGELGKAAKDAKTYGKSLETVGDGADRSEARVLGLKDTVDGTAAIMAGPGKAGIAAYLQGWADLASGVANFVVPAIKAISVASIRTAVTTAASTVATKAAAAASKAWAAAQWLLNAALTANPIGLAVAAIAGLVAVLVVAYRKSETFREIVDGAFRAVGKAAGWLKDKVVDAARWMWDKLGPVGDLIGRLVGKFKNWVSSGDDAAESTERTAEAVREANEAFQKHYDRITAINTALLAADNAEIGFYTAVDNATKSLKDNGKTLDVHTEKGRANKTALFQLADQVIKWRAEADDGTRSQRELNDIMNTGYNRFVAAATGMGMSASQAKELARRLNLIPKNTDVTVSVRMSGVGAFQKRIAELTRTRSMDVVINTNFESRVAQSYRPAGRASGGVSGGMTWVGERGPELVRLPQGSTVYPAGQSAQMTGGGGVARVELSWAGGNAGDEFMNWLRKNIRVTSGGNVQTALGS